jgi:hypothetical protein
MAPIASLAMRDECTSTQPPEEAPRYLMLTAPATERALRCGPVAASVALERVGSAGEASARLDDAEVAGIIFDRSTLESLPDGLVQQWLITGTGRILIGLQLTHWEVQLYFSSPPEPRSSLTPDQRGESTDLVGRAYLARLHFKRTGSETCGGRGTVYSSESRLPSILLRTAEGCGIR